MKLIDTASLSLAAERRLGLSPGGGIGKFTLSAKCYTTISEQQRERSLKTFYSRPLYLFTMSDYTIENRQEVVNVLVGRVIENAPLRELIRVYSEAVNAAIANLSDADVVRSIAQANYVDILEGFELEVPPAPEASEEAPAAEGEAVEA